MKVLAAKYSEDLVPEEATLDVARFVDGDIEKFYPISEGDTKQRKRKPHIVAVINEMCTGCSGSPACVDYCPVAACMFWVPDSEHAPFGRIMVDPLQTLHQQGAGWRVPRRLPVGCD